MGALSRRACQGVSHTQKLCTISTAEYETKSALKRSNDLLDLARSKQALLAFLLILQEPIPSIFVYIYVMLTSSSHWDQPQMIRDP